MIALEELDKICHPEPNDEIPPDSDLGRQCLDWLIPPPPSDPPND